MQTDKEKAVDFLNQVVAGHIDDAYTKYVDMHGTHHNAYFLAGFTSLKQAMLEDHAQHPNKRITVKNAIGEADLVAVHSHLVFKPGELEMSVVHIFRFKDGMIVEMWDIGQGIPMDSPNQASAF